MDQSHIFRALGFGASVVLFGCNPTAELEPARAAHQAPGLERAAMARQSGVQVTAQATPWPGEDRIERKVTPLRIVVQNEASTPIAIRYQDFRILAPDGTEYRVIPPRKTRGTVARDGRAGEPELGYPSFRSEPHYGSIYRDIDPFRPYDPDVSHHERHPAYFDAVSLPTQEMLDKALPEGVVEPGGHLDGYLYFERVNRRDRTVTLRVDLTDARSGKAFTRVELPFDVK